MTIVLHAFCILARARERAALGGGEGGTAFFSPTLSRARAGAQAGGRTGERAGSLPCVLVPLCLYRVSSTLGPSLWARRDRL